MKIITLKVNEDLCLQLKAAAKAYDDSLNGYITITLYQAIEEIHGGSADMEIYEKELKRLRKL